MAFYPIFLNLDLVDILVAGGGEVGKRKVRSVLASAPRSITIVDPFLEDSAEEFQASNVIRLCKREFELSDLEGKTLVFACTNNRAINILIAEECSKQGILCNSATSSTTGSFIVPAHFSHNGISVALSTSGQSPALARYLREDLEAYVGTRYTKLLTVLSRLRPLLLGLEQATEDNTVIFRTLVHSPLGIYLEAGDNSSATTLLLGILPKSLHSRVGDLLHGF